MDLKPVQRTVSDWFRKTAGGENRPVMFDVEKTYPSLLQLDAAYPEIRAELDEVLRNRDTLPAYHDLDPDQATISDASPEQWKIFYLWAMGERAEPNSSRCPATTAALAKIPNLFQAFFSVLEPGKSVPEHEGPYCGYLRYHLGMVVPDERPPRIRVKDTEYTWREGESVLFDDSWNHEVYNDCPQERVVLIVDVLRPMPLPQHLVNRGLAVVARHVYGRKVLARAAEKAKATQA
ncbi:aspartate beta-hydroxylase/beta-hydroxylase [Herbihabitans rhizosphaerae]|uniref:Aspartate beta-hydroxylase/beta-hydroxylase n=1 Tax=Herbihabitans rhizosphaerae TaxID=1872711 RepID=A0A4Q7KNK0_9PSEU|nr:aspartyl/asparaginyl beta-hydroxylase domain-containing protein [Herbihabitans rhizosphaerae]RZS36802.1 aspartate beta-hydroxylase/beta-hydroxylase [Herbihabitans rhizosphaerae]